ncbi:hypothetical protein ACH50P_20910, partial [Sulfitobacter sp. M22386]
DVKWPRRAIACQDGWSVHFACSHELRGSASGSLENKRPPVRRPRNRFSDPATLSGGQPPNHCDGRSVFHMTADIVDTIMRQSNGRKSLIKRFAAEVMKVRSVL